MFKDKNFKIFVGFVVVFIFFSLATTFLFYRATQFDNNYPNPLPNELTAKSIEIEESSEINEKCSFPPETGQCRGYFEKYYYDTVENKCEKYIYGGCGDYAFDTLEVCESSCVKP